MGCIDIDNEMLAGLYQYRLGIVGMAWYVGWAVSI